MSETDKKQDEHMAKDKMLVRHLFSRLRELNGGSDVISKQQLRSLCEHEYVAEVIGYSSRT